MNTKFQIQIKTRNWEGGSPTITKEISINDIIKFSELIKKINQNSGNKNWNWFSSLPNKWDGKRFILDTWLLRQRLDEYFNYNPGDINIIKEFFLRFTPHGCDAIEYIKLFKVEEITEY